MALDGIFLSNIVAELKERLIGGRIDKVYQPEKDEITLLIRNNAQQYRLLYSVNASHTRIGLSEEKKENPISAPMFCMLLRKHIQNGKILDISQINFDRVVNMKVESYDELGNLSYKTLIIEIMGRHSNIILIDDSKKIIDSIKRVNAEMSAVREVLPSKEYFFIATNKINPMDANINFDMFSKAILENSNFDIAKAIYTSFNGISPISAQEIVERAGINASFKVLEINIEEINKIFISFDDFFTQVKNEKYKAQIVFNNKTDEYIDFVSFDYSVYSNFDKEYFDSPSSLIEKYYLERANQYIVKQKTFDIRKLISNEIERAYKKKEILKRTLAKTQKLNEWKLFGELLTANAYNIEKNIKLVFLENYYAEDLEKVEIELDPDLNAIENAQKYYDRYNKSKRTIEAVHEQEIYNDSEIEYLESVMQSIETAKTNSDIDEIRDELVEEKYLKRKSKNNGKQNKNKKSKFEQFVSTDGFVIYLGKNNKQNDELSTRKAKKDDMWLHTKNIPGSHVIIESENQEIPERTLLEAASLAAYYSKARESSNVAVDYTLVKYLKKIKGAKPGMLTYTNNKTIFVEPKDKI